MPAITLIFYPHGFSMVILIGISLTGRNGNIAVSVLLGMPFCWGKVGVDSFM